MNLKNVLTHKKNHPNSLEPHEEQYLLNGLHNKQCFDAFDLECFPYWLEQKKHPAGFFDFEQSLLLNNTNNLNWTQISCPKTHDSFYVDERGLLFLNPNHFSIDVWVSIGDHVFLPSQCKPSLQTFDLDTVSVQTQFEWEGLHICMQAQSLLQQERPLVQLRTSLSHQNQHPISGHVYFVIRPYSTHGFTPIHHISYIQQQAFMINHQLAVILEETPENILCNPLTHADLLSKRNAWQYLFQASCKQGSVTALASYPFKIKAKEPFHKRIFLPLTHHKPCSKKPLSQPIWAPFLKKRLSELKHTHKSPFTMDSTIKNLSPFYTNQPYLQNTLNHSLFYLKYSPKQSHLSFLSDDDSWLSYSIMILGLLQTNLLVDAIYYLNLVKKRLHKSSDLAHHLRFICLLMITYEHQKDLELIKSNEKIIQKSLKLMLKNNVLETLLNALNKPSLFHQIQRSQIESLFYLIFISKRLCKNTVLSSCFKTEFKQLFHTQAFKNLLKSIRPSFIKKLFVQQTFYKLYTHPLLFAASLLDLFDESIKLLIYKLFSTQLLHQQQLFLSTKVSGIYPSYMMQYLILENQLDLKKQTKPLVFQSLFDLCSNTSNWPNICSVDTKKGKYGLGHDIALNALFIRLYHSFLIQDKHDHLVLFKGISQLVDGQESYSFHQKHLQSSQGILCFSLKKTPKHFSLKISIESLKTVSVLCVFPETITSLRGPNHFRNKLEDHKIPITISNESKEFIFQCHEHKPKVPANTYHH